MDTSGTVHVKRRIRVYIKIKRDGYELRSTSTPYYYFRQILATLAPRRDIFGIQNVHKIIPYALRLPGIFITWLEGVVSEWSISSLPGINVAAHVG
jgi:hypothetical protein